MGRDAQTDGVVDMTAQTRCPDCGALLRDAHRANCPRENRPKLGIKRPPAPAWEPPAGPTGRGLGPALLGPVKGTAPLTVLAPIPQK